ncbi:unnamed protein product [Ranitomeya imitator]|uniref:DCC-interacting protein 13-beta n=1 Tax=Ranitomeya imitator TaxID=111125 RepID=A0ABN9LR47_9NEOB|nr:unnamed protein product [Ranitomeya imitator]
MQRLPAAVERGAGEYRALLYTHLLLAQSLVPRRRQLLPVVSGHTVPLIIVMNMQLHSYGSGVGSIFITVMEPGTVPGSGEYDYTAAPADPWLKAEIAKEVAGARRKQHLSSLQYYCALNALQYRKRTAMLDPILGYTQGQIAFLKKGYEMFSKKMDGFLASVSCMIQRIQGELDAEAEAMRITQQELLSGSDALYTPDCDVSSPVINRNLLQKAGYLNMRSKTGLVTTTWERLYFFTQGGNLMCQHRGEVAGGLIQDLDNCSVMAVDCEDRRYCFQITAPNGKSGRDDALNARRHHPLTEQSQPEEPEDGGAQRWNGTDRSLILQAEGKREYEEWISAINNISRQIYLSDNPEAVAIKLNQTAQQAVTPITSFDKKLENTPQSSESVMQTVSQNESLPEPSPKQPEPEQLIAPGTPIQFDIVLPATEFQDQNRGNRRTNPFGESDDKLDGSTDEGLLLQQMFVVRFLGSMAVKTDHTNQVIFEAMRQVLAARAIHNIFRMTESHLMVTSKSIRLIDPQTQVIRTSFDLENITQFAAHLENKRLVGFIVCTPEASGVESLSAYILESNTEGEKM